jgi:hypothetical protein
MIPQSRRFSAKSVIGGLLAASILGAGAALAVEHASAGPVSITPAASSSTPTPTPSPGKHSRAPKFGAGFGGVGAGQILGLLTKDTGLTPMQIFQDIQNGQTLKQIAGSNADKLKTDALAAIKTELDTAVTKQVITSAQESTLLKDAGDAIDVLMTANLSKLGLGSGAKFPFGGGHHENGPKPTPTPSV